MKRVERTESEKPREIAPGVHWIAVGKGLLRSNVYFVQAGSSWSLVDAGSAGCAPPIRHTAEHLFGADRPPAAILLTHDHPDHSGPVRELAAAWNCGVWMHPDEMPLALGAVPAFYRYANPLDRWVVLPMLRLVGRRRAEAIVARASLEGLAQAFDPHSDPPGLPGWRAIPAAGHTPGHVAFFRVSDRVLITGDALVTVNLNSLKGILFKERRVSAPPRYTSWSWRVTRESVTRLARLEPRVLAGGHGVPMDGPEAASELRTLAERFC